MTQSQKQYLSIIAAIAILAGGYVWATGNRTEEKRVEREQGAEGQEQEETAGWKTYRNEQYGFEVKYPTELILREIVPNTENQLLIVSFRENEEEDKGYHIFIEVDRKGFTRYVSSDKTLVIGGETAVDYSHDDPLAQISGINTIWPHGSLEFFAGVRWPYSYAFTDKATNRYRLTLSTFKFTK